MRIVNFGSLNIDHVYRVRTIARPGETVASKSYQVFAGGKGANQSVALARAGVRVWHAGQVGEDGRWLIAKLRAYGVCTEHIHISEAPTGHAIIQVDDCGQNAIVLFAGANHSLRREMIDDVLANFGEGDLLLLQNEVNDIPYIMTCAHRRGMKVCFNPAPFTDEVARYPLQLVSTLVLNETEAAELTGAESPAEALSQLRRRFSDCEIILTCGGDGVLFRSEGAEGRFAAYRVKAVDTTAAGDTFIGYYLAGMVCARPLQERLSWACAAAALCVTRPGAMDSIPSAKEVVEFSTSLC